VVTASRNLALDRARVGKCEVLEAGTTWDFNSNTLMATTRRLGNCKGYTCVYGQVAQVHAACRSNSGTIT
jgi:hypothetical protein